MCARARARVDYSATAAVKSPPPPPPFRRGPFIYVAGRGRAADSPRGFKHLPLFFFFSTATKTGTSLLYTHMYVRVHVYNARGPRSIEHTRTYMYGCHPVRCYRRRVVKRRVFSYYTAAAAVHTRARYYRTFLACVCVCGLCAADRPE